MKGDAEEQSMDEDRVEGGAKRAKGSVKETIGKVTGNDRTEAEGRADKAEGQVQGKVDQAKDTIREALKK
jgi:uncharacterized protein YjbJ (UPF0337 family)